MNDQVNPTPAWRPYADQVVQKLLAHRRHRALVANPLAALSNQDVEPYDLSELNLPATAGEAAAEAVPDAEAAATGQAPRATPDLSPRALSLVIRLAATLGSEAAMRAASTPGAITAIHGLTRTMARDLGKHRIRVNAVVPGWIMTDRQKELWVTPASIEAHRNRQCLPDLIDPVYVARMVLFLASDDAAMCTASSYMVEAGSI